MRIATAKSFAEQNKRLFVRKDGRNQRVTYLLHGAFRVPAHVSSRGQRDGYQGIAINFHFLFEGFDKATYVMDTIGYLLIG